MCGIVGILSKEQHSIKVHTLCLLKRLEYRGYDSVGVGTNDGRIRKATGSVAPFVESIDDQLTKVSMAHTRWATHGGVSEVNAHPHADSTGEFMVVHNGIIENADTLREGLPSESFVSETDTEIIAAFFHDRVARRGVDVEKAIREFFNTAEGTYAVLLMRRGGRALYAFKKDSPLAFACAPGLCGGSSILASDISAFGNLADKAVFFDDYTYCVVTPAGPRFHDRSGRKIDPPEKSFQWAGDVELKDYPHYMIKEIMEQPVCARRLLESFNTIQKKKVETFAGYMKKKRRIVFLSCGTSYHASLIGAHLLSRLGYEAHAVIASEFDSFILVDPSTFVIAISQSGETMDVIQPLKQIRTGTAKVGSIVNVPYSTIQRLSDITLDLLAGPEICVASTKAFTNQVITLIKLVECLGYETNTDEIPDKIRQTLEAVDPVCRRLAVELKDRREIYVLGKGVAYPMAREIALKLKEIDYIHAEGMMAGELKHGTLALVESGTPVICLVPDDDPAMLASTHEVAARGARTIIVSNTGKGDVNVPRGCHAEFGIGACLFGHLLSYYIGVERGLPIDKPRNLAKSVTVR